MPFFYIAGKSRTMLLFVMRTSSWIGLIIIILIAAFLWRVFARDGED